MRIWLAKNDPIHARRFTNPPDSIAPDAYRSAGKSLITAQYTCGLKTMAKPAVARVSPVTNCHGGSRFAIQTVMSNTNKGNAAWYLESIAQPAKTPAPNYHASCSPLLSAPRPRLARRTAYTVAAKNMTKTVLWL